jgi:alkanesulfonate monooxygenase SsuD/methylene tetrahydromethanopterin reductase-like flavin-dependent oxidoreductase (luciferase family)
VIVSTTAFVQAADTQSKALGHEPTIVWVPHPIQDRTDEELRALADRAFDEIVARTTGASR